MTYRLTLLTLRLHHLPTPTNDFLIQSNDPNQRSCHDLQAELEVREVGGSCYQISEHSEIQSKKSEKSRIKIWFSEVRSPFLRIFQWDRSWISWRFSITFRISLESKSTTRDRSWTFRLTLSSGFVDCSHVIPHIFWSLHSCWLAVAFGTTDQAVLLIILDHTLKTCCHGRSKSVWKEWGGGAIYGRHTQCS